MMADSPAPQFTTARRLALIFGVWALVAVMSTQTSVFALTRTGRVFDWRPIFFSNLSSCMLWAAFTPFLLALGRRFRMERGVWPVSLAIHLVIGVAFTALDVFSWRLEAPFIRPGAPPSTSPFLAEVARALLLDLGWYCIVVALAHADHYATLSREEALRRAQLQSQLDAARLDALQSQLRPHFLFNTLTTIAEQVYGDPAGADTMITRLSRLLRSSFVDPEVQEVTLRQELELLQCYLDIARVRFRERLTIDLDIHPNALDAFVPRFLLQPLAENALHHGLEPAESGGRLELRVRAHLDTMTVELRDDGVGLPPGELRTGTGIRNTRQRLTHLYGNRSRLEIEARPGGGTTVRVTLPFRREPDPLAPDDAELRPAAADVPYATAAGAQA
jgi:signal transduction histidine kinase